MTWSVYAVSVARKSAPTVKVLEQHVRAESAEDAAARVLRDQRPSVGVLSVRVLRPCSVRETAEALASDRSGTRDVTESRWREAFAVVCHELGVEE